MRVHFWLRGFVWRVVALPWLAVGLGLAALSLRAAWPGAGSDVFHPSLWAEDGAVFITEAQARGLHSLLLPYNGYLHLYPRLTALFAVYLPLEWIPYVFHTAWLIACGGACFVLAFQTLRAGVHPAIVLALGPAIILQPSSGEIFFTLTNAQWFLALGAGVWLLYPADAGASWKQLLILAVLGMTGPFLTMLLPIVAFRDVLNRDFRGKAGRYVVLVSCAILQLFYLVSSTRLSARPGVTPDEGGWLSAIRAFLNFGGENRMVLLGALIFWISAVSCSVRPRLHPTGAAARVDNSALALALAASAFLAAGLLAAQPGPGEMSPTGSAGRYFFLPYSWLFISAFTLSRRRRFATAGLVVAVTLLGVAAWRAPSHPDYQFGAFSRFAMSMPGLLIPIAPLVPSFPGWYIDAGYGYGGGDPDDRVFDVSADQVYVISGERDGSGWPLSLADANGSVRISFDIGTGCGQADTIGMVVGAERRAAGWIQVFWGGNLGFTAERSLRRWYPAGAVRAQFAFKRSLRDHTVRIDLADQPGPLSVGGIRVYCMR